MLLDKRGRSVNFIDIGNSSNLGQEHYRKLDDARYMYNFVIIWYPIRYQVIKVFYRVPKTLEIPKIKDQMMTIKYTYIFFKNIYKTVYLIRILVVFFCRYSLENIIMHEEEIDVVLTPKIHEDVYYPEVVSCIKKHKLIIE